MDTELTHDPSIDSSNAPDHDDAPATWDDAIADFERRLLERLFVHYPSTRKLAARLSTSHTMIATRLRKYGIRRGP